MRYSDGAQGSSEGAQEQKSIEMGIKVGLPEK
jgi:hypothetical protein